MKNEENDILKAIKENNTVAFKCLFKKEEKYNFSKLIINLIENQHDNLEIFKEILERQLFFKETIDINGLFKISCDFNQIEIAKYLVERPDFIFNDDYQETFCNVCNVGYQEIFNTLYTLPETDVNYGSNLALNRAFAGKNLSIFKTLLSNENIDFESNHHSLIIDIFDIRSFNFYSDSRFNFFNAILKHKSYKNLKEKLKDFNPNNLKDDTFYLLKILFSFREYQESIKIYFLNRGEKEYFDFFNKIHISKKMVDF